MKKCKEQETARQTKELQRLHKQGLLDNLAFSDAAAHDLGIEEQIRARPRQEAVMTGTVKEIIEAKRRAGEEAYLWVTHSGVIALYATEADSFGSGTPLQSWELDPIERDQIIETGLVDGVGVLGSPLDTIYERAEAICVRMLQRNAPTDPTLFDRIINQLAAAGVEINQEATTKARTECPNVIAVFRGEMDAPDEWDYIEVIDGEVATWGTRGEIQAELLTAQQAQHYYDDPPITLEDLAGLRYIERAGEKLYDECDLTLISNRKTEERKARWEEQRTLSLDLPDEFLLLCEQYGLTPDQALRGFIADVCGIVNYVNNPDCPPRMDGYNSNGSDERDMADSYFKRAHWSPEVEEKHGISVY